MATAKPRDHIRTEESRLRESLAKDLVQTVLQSNGFRVEATRNSQSRFFIDVRDPSGCRRTLWFKLGWNPGEHGSSAVQIQMIKERACGKRPSELTDADYAQEVTKKIGRAHDAGATDLLLFSLDSSNVVPIACIILPISRAGACYRECLGVNRQHSRKGASPTFWLQGNSPATRMLQHIVEKYASENLLDPASKTPGPRLDDAIEDLLPDAAIGAERRIMQVGRFVREPAIRARALARADGICEFCNQAGFKRPDGSRYLKSHHIQSLGEDGPDTVENVIALCANDHRAAHFSAEKDMLAEQMRRILAEKLGS